MEAKPMSKSKIVSHIAEKCGTPKKTAVLFFEELFKLAVKECKGGAGKFVIPNIGRAVKAHRRCATLRHNSSQPRHFCARGACRSRRRNAPRTPSYGRVPMSRSPQTSDASRRERLANWLALLALLAAGIVWAPADAAGTMLPVEHAAPVEAMRQAPRSRCTSASAPSAARSVSVSRRKTSISRHAAQAGRRVCSTSNARTC